MRRFSSARALFASCSAVVVIAASALPAYAASTMNGIQVTALPNGGAVVSVAFAGGVPSYHVIGAGTAETSILFDGTTLGPQLPPSIAGAGPISTLSVAQTGASASIALHLASTAPVTVRPGGNSLFISVAPAHPDANPFNGPNGLPGLAPATPPPGQIVEIYSLKYADVSEVAGILVNGSNVASNDTFTPQQTSLGTNSLNNSFGGVSGNFGQPAQAQSFGGAFGQATGLAQRLNDNIAIDRRLNAIILTGTPDVLAPIKAMIEKIDIPVQSVILETQIVELSDTASRNIGLDLSPDGTGAIVEAVNSSDSTGVSLRSGANIVSGANLSANLYAQVQAGNAKIIAKPRILAQSGQQASILTGDAIPIVTNVVVAGAGSISSQQVNYVNVGVNLQIQPRVSSDGYVTSHIYSEVSSVTQYVNGIPQISQRTASTLATVRDGEAFVIGGLLQDNEIRNLSKLPFIGDLPLIGQLFQHVNTSHTQTNLYVVVTPHIVAAPGVQPYSAPLSVPTSLPQVGAPPPPDQPAATSAPLVAPPNHPIVTPAPGPTTSPPS